MNPNVPKPVHDRIKQHVETLLAESAVQRSNASEIAQEWHEHIVDLYLDARGKGISELGALDSALQAFGGGKAVAAPMRRQQRALAFRRAFRWPAIVLAWILVEAAAAPFWITPQNGFPELGVFPIVISSAAVLVAVVVILRLFSDSISRYRVTWLRVVLSIEAASVTLFLALLGVQAIFGAGRPVVALTLTLVLMLGAALWATTRSQQRPRSMRKSDA